MNFLIGFFQLACFLSAVIPPATCQIPIDTKIPTDYLLMPWRQMETKLYVHTREYPQGIQIDSKKGLYAIRRNVETEIITHGYRGSKNDLQIIVREYLKKKEGINVITLDWRYMAAAGPYQAALGAVSLGFTLAYQISWLMFEFDIQPEQIHLIGFNMGAHLMGVAGTYQESPLGRITGLDPSKDFFNKSSIVRLPGLNRRSAMSVDILHTSAGGIGIDEAIGTADFFPNGGKIQPKCQNDSELCNAVIALEYYAESIAISDSFMGLACFNYEEFLDNRCRGRREAIFGDFGSSYLPGTYFFRTNDRYPYGLKKDGEYPERLE